MTVLVSVGIGMFRKRIHINFISRGTKDQILFKKPIYLYIFSRTLNKFLNKHQKFNSNAMYHSPFQIDTVSYIRDIVHKIQYFSSLNKI